MDELKLMEDFCRDVAPTRQRALNEGRSRLLSEFKEPRRGRSSRPVRPVVRVVAVGALAVAIASGITIAQNVGGDAPANRPGRVGILPGGPVANAQEVALRAKAAAQAQPAITLTPGQWIYVKTRTAEINGETLGPRTKYSTNEAWLTVEGKSPPREDRVVVPVSEPTAKVLIDLPSDPDAALARLYAEVDRINDLVKRPTGQNASEPLAFRNGILDTPRGVAAFNLVSEILESYYVPPRLQATLYGALARMPGVRMLPDSVDAQGRHGLALYVMSEGYIRQEIILDRNTYRYLGSRWISVKDHTVPPVGKGVETDSRTPIHIKKGSVLGLSAQLASAPVGKPGERP
ncbi:CU044_5270 family protein [Actinomadura alba]|uniref:CU044_5270 family protein n=1 Tax=Actinomadura alba TaxID=406431 RepID=A0ABR7LN73_9ACTN|nr:CU044_5270 family protein [Actinomadura alba]MBC6466283.1 CU044_5270 family protein [Actinomadura alba]